MFGNWVCGSDSRQDMSPALMQRADEVLTELYRSALEKEESYYDIRDEIYCNYWKIRFFTGDIDLHEYEERVSDFCMHVIENGGFDENENELFVDSRYFQINMYHYPNIASVVKANDGSAEHMEALKKKILPQFLHFVEELPKSTRVPFVNGGLQRTMMDLALAFGTDAIDAVFCTDFPQRGSGKCAAQCGFTDSSGD